MSIRCALQVVAFAIRHPVLLWRMGHCGCGDRHWHLHCEDFTKEQKE